MDVFQKIKALSDAIKVRDVAAAFEAAAELIKLGGTLWRLFNPPREGVVFAQALPCDPSDDAKVCEFLDACCAPQAAPGVLAGAALPWGILLPLLLKWLTSKLGA